MKLLFLFMSQSSASPGAIKEWNPEGKKCGEFYDKFKGECYFELVKELLRKGVISDLKIIYESNKEPGMADWLPGVHCEVLPHISFAEKYIEEDTVIFVRGGFKHWFELLLKYKGKNWLLVYAANTGRERWTEWDVVLDDLGTVSSFMDSFSRIWCPFIKPVNEEYFFPVHPAEPDPVFDVCIGSSHIHDRKGQWRVAVVAEAFRNLFNKDLKMVLPGLPKGGGIRTQEMYRSKYFQKQTSMVGYVDRKELNNIFSQTKIYVHLGAHGQNDRGPLEALAAGMPIVLGSPKYHSPLLARMSSVVKNLEDYKSIAESLHILLSIWTPGIKKRVFQYYHENCSFDISVDKFSQLLRLLSSVGTKPTVHNKDAIISILDKDEA